MRVLLEENREIVEEYAEENWTSIEQATEEIIEGIIMTKQGKELKMMIAEERKFQKSLIENDGVGRSDEPMFWQDVDDLSLEKESRVALDSRLTRCIPKLHGTESAVEHKPRTEELNTLVAREGTATLSSIPAASWRELEVTVDSGACDTVIPTDVCKEIKLQESAQSKQGMEYEVANGETIPNLGERRCLMMTQGSMAPKRIAFQVADVHKPLLSVTRAADMGYQCVLGKSGGWLQDSQSDERIPIQRKGNLYVMKVWVKECPFSGQR